MYLILILIFNFFVRQFIVNQSPTLQLHQWCLLKLRNFIKDKCLYEAKFLL